VFGLLQLLMISSLLMWPMIVLLEAFIYWLIRRRNRLRAMSWTHSVIFVLAFLLNILFILIQNMHYRYSSVEGRVNWHIMIHKERYLFFGLVILAHLAFIAVLANCFRKMAPVPEGKGQGQENLLDDVVL
jgi:cytochrome c biogenesis factor